MSSTPHLQPNREESNSPARAEVLPKERSVTADESAVCRLNLPHELTRRQQVEDRGESGCRSLRPLRLIINADDFGLSRAINERIVGLVSQGHLTSATLVANGVAVEEAARLAGDHERCSFGVHLNLTEGPPLTNSPELRAILDGRGCFAGNRIREVKITSALRQAVYHEWCAQVAKVLSLGVRVSHLDSHHHVHTVSGLFGALKSVQNSYKIYKVRISRNVFAPGEGSPLLRTKKALWNFALRHYRATTTTEGFTTLEVFYQLARAGLHTRHSCMELMAHPGAAMFEKETQLLERDWRKEVDRPVKLISYSEL